jgi:hypothetical protein
LIICAILLTTCATHVLAQSKNVVKVNVLSIGALTFSGFYERAINNRWSLQGGYSYTHWLEPPWTGITFRGHNLTLEGRYYAQKNKTALEGLYIGAFLRYRHNPLFYYRWGDESAQAVKNSYGGGIIAGYQLPFEKRRYSVDIFAGPQLHRHAIAEDSKWAFKALINPIGFRLGATIGYKF